MPSIFRVSGKTEFNRRLHGNAVSATPFATQQCRNSTQASFGFFFGERLIQDEMRSAAQNVACSGAFGNQCHGDGCASGVQPAALFKNFSGGLRVFEIDNQCVKPLLSQTVNGSAEITEALHRDTRCRKYPAQDLGSGVVSGNQQCQKGGHNEIPA